MENKNGSKSEPKVRIALIKRDRESRNERSKHNDQKVRWDEEAIAEHDILRGTRQKIDEPNTPYNYDFENEHSGYESGESVSRNSITGVSPGKGREDLEKVIKAVKMRIPSANELDKERHERWDTSEGEDSAKKNPFKQKRQKHYNEYIILKQWKASHSMCDSDSECEEGKSGPNGDENNGDVDEICKDLDQCGKDGLMESPDK
mmetsp:Transcript_1090/g.1650  ORF Transcript_1090/g.1650 Transcript_1090/m.1650 type:complete len:204 (+) Transcript_1090:42-653(+)